MKTSMHRAIRLLKKIPKGRVATYKELARVCRTSPRAIGSVMASNREPREYPCYKIVSSSGELGGYSGPGGTRGKRKLLKQDGIPVDGGRIAKKYFYRFKR